MWISRDIGAVVVDGGDGGHAEHGRGRAGRGDGSSRVGLMVVGRWSWELQ